MHLGRGAVMRNVQWLIEDLLCTHTMLQTSTVVTLSNSHNNPIDEALLVYFIRKKIGAPQVRQLPKITQPTSGGTQI